jgi:serine/threonine-protein kinase
MVQVYVPAGEFLMGSNKKEDPNTDDDELPQHKVFLEECWISKYPVTNLQYSAFVEVTGYRCPDHWPNGLIPPGKEQHPVVYVRWDDACAFCEWVSQVTGEKVRLPSEAVWEKAARGTSGRIWPWGNQLPDKALCNFDENVRGTTPVGEYSPQGDSPYGCADMIDHVWEWTSSLYSSYPYRAEDGREQLNVRALRILRGGSFRSNQESARCAYRYGDYPGLTLDIGFRVALLPSKTLMENIK